MVQDKRKALGRGLESLLPGRFSASQTKPAPGAGSTQEVSLELIDPNPFQTRRRIKEESLNELADSIRSSGVVQPVVLRPAPNGRFQLVAGERRWLASKRVGKTAIPAVIRQISNEQAMEITIIENLQREDLNAIDQAEAYERLSREFGLTQEQMALKTGKPRSEVANYLRLLKLPGPVKHEVLMGAVSFSHAKVLMSLEDPELIQKIAKQTIGQALSVRQLEDLVFDTKHPVERDKPQPKYVDPNVREAEKELERSLGVRVRIKDKRGKGKIVIEYATLEDFDRVVERLGKK
jgi:ParB family transcriptional regulator, chromosome partitioning protein